ncbi:MAG: hypothetical protein IKP28_01165 [Clostridia bacterium]|nr:hypothetical protein [Clostridia bacterium]
MGIIGTDIVKNIRKNRIVYVIIFLTSAVILPCIPFAIVNFYYMDARPELVIEIFCEMATFALVPAGITMYNIIIMINPYRRKIFQRYGSYQNIKNILCEINDTFECQYGNAIISKNYIVDVNNYEKLSAFQDILRAYTSYSKNSGSIIVFTDKYFYNFSIAVPRSNFKYILPILQDRCTNAVFDSFSNTKKKYEELPKIDAKEIKQEYLEYKRVF